MVNIVQRVENNSLLLKDNLLSEQKLLRDEYNHCLPSCLRGYLINRYVHFMNDFKMSQTLKLPLSYDVAVIQWIISCHKNRMTTLARRRNVIDNVRVNNVFLIEIMVILKAIKSHFKGSYDEQNLTLVVI